MLISSKYILSRFQIPRGLFASTNVVRNSSDHMRADDVLVDEPYKYEKCINEVRLLGRVGNDPVTFDRFGKSCIQFQIATAKSPSDVEGMIHGQPDWHLVFTYNPVLIKSLELFVKKGHRLYVSGKLSNTTDPSTREKVMGVMLFRYISFS